LHPDDLKTIWQCAECGRNFVFHSDAEQHRNEFHHSEMVSRDFQSGRGGFAEFRRGQATIGFRLDSGATAQVIVEYKYYPTRDSISYIDVTYTDQKLQAMVEGNAEMMKNIDNYLRKEIRQKSTQSVRL
jgi:hypothetical protein